MNWLGLMTYRTAYFISFFVAKWRHGWNQFNVNGQPNYPLRLDE